MWEKRDEEEMWEGRDEEKQEGHDVGKWAARLEDVTLEASGAGGSRRVLRGGWHGTAAWQGRRGEDARGGGGGRTG